MKAVVWHGIGDIRIDEVPKPKIEKASDAIIRVTASAICGTDLHFIRGTMPDMQEGTILGHEAVGVVEELGKDVRNFKIGDRVVIPSTIACGYCAYCRAGYFAQCDNSNPNGPLAGTAFFGGPKSSGPFNGLQAEWARIPYASVGMVKLPEEVSDDQAILLSDIFPTAYFGAELAEIKRGDAVAVFGCGPVGQFTIASAKLLGSGRLFAIDQVESRLEMARAQGAETINFSKEDPVETLRRLTGGIGVDRAIDAVGIEAETSTDGPGAQQAQKHKADFEQEVKKIAPVQNPKGKNWKPGEAPSQALWWAVEGLAKAGTLSIIGVYPETAERFPIGTAMNKNLTVKMGNCNHRAYIPRLIEIVNTGIVNPEKILTKEEPLESAIEAYEHFDLRQSGWTKVKLEPAAA